MLDLLCIFVIHLIIVKNCLYYIDNSHQDWRTNIPYRLGIPGDFLGENNLIDRLDYFGWVWEPDSINEVTVTTKYDETNINVSLWYVGVK